MVKVFGGQLRERALSQERACVRHALKVAALHHADHARSQGSPRRDHLSFDAARSLRATVGEFTSFITAMLMLLAPLAAFRDQQRAAARLASAESVFAMIDRSGGGRPRHRDHQAPRRAEVRRRLLYLPDAHRARARRSICISAPVRRSRWSVAPAAARPRSSTCFPRYAPTSGRICSTGDLQTSPLESLRANIALVSQEIVLFNDTIYANIAYGRMGGAAEKDVIAAAEAAHAMEFIRETRRPEDPHWRERPAAFRRPAPAPRDRARGAQERASPYPGRGDLGARLGVRAPRSGGARGADARAHYDRHHASSPPSGADRIVVLERGRIVETGSRLIGRDGVYAKLYRIQYAAERAAA